jgi:hypothetical protein
MAGLLEELRDRPPVTVREVQSKWQLADTHQDAWTFFAVFVLALTAEWLLRKRWGLA